MGKETSKNILSTIQYPDDLRRLKLSQLPRVCEELRQFIIDELSHNPGHFGSTLGVIELTVALQGGIRHLLVGNIGHLPLVRDVLDACGVRDKVTLHGDLRLNVANTPAAARLLLSEHCRVL